LLLVSAVASLASLVRRRTQHSEQTPPERNGIYRRSDGGGETVWMQPPFDCDYGANIEFGERVFFFNFNCIVLDVCRVRIGDSRYGPAVQIYTPLHPLNGAQRRREEFGKPIDIGSEVWSAVAR
jgi:maltose O-acetyltransferase